MSSSRNSLNNRLPGDGSWQWQPNGNVAAESQVRWLPKGDVDGQNVSKGGKGLAQKSGKDTDRKRMLRRAFSSPDRESREHEMKKAKTELQQRNKIMQDIKDGLLDFHDHPKVVKALHLCLDSRLGIMEACNRDYNIGTTVHRIAEVRSLGPIVTTLAKKLIDAWYGEYTVNRPSLLASSSQRVEQLPRFQGDGRKTSPEPCFC